MIGPADSQTELLQRVSEDPFGLHLFVQHSEWRELEADPTPAVSLLQHRLNIFFSLLCTHYANLEQVSQHEPLIQHAREEIFRVLLSEEHGFDKGKAKNLFRVLRSNFTKGPDCISPFQPYYLWRTRSSLPPV